MKLILQDLSNFGTPGTITDESLQVMPLMPLESDLMRWLDGHLALVKTVIMVFASLKGSEMMEQKADGDL